MLPPKIIFVERLYFENENKYFFVSDSGYILKEQFEVPENAFQIVTSGMSGNVGEIKQVKIKSVQNDFCIGE